MNGNSTASSGRRRHIASGRREGGRWGLPENVKEGRAVVEEGTEREVTAKEGRAVIDCGAGEVLTSRADRSASSAVLFSLLSRDRPPVAPALTDTESVCLHGLCTSGAGISHFVIYLSVSLGLMTHHGGVTTTFPCGFVIKSYNIPYGIRF